MIYVKTSKVTSEKSLEEVSAIVKDILNDVRENGDAAVLKYEEKFGASNRPFRVTQEEIDASILQLTEETKILIDRVVERVSAFAEAQLKCLQPFEAEFGEGIQMGHRIVPIDKVGAYVPGGRFPLLSSGPMVVAPAKVAGVKRIVACSPANYKGGIHPAVLYGLVKSGATDIFAIGGAQAIAAMAYGTETVPAVNMISGPGNKFVAEAKKQVFGKVGIDLIAGPSEVMVMADEHGNAFKIAADLLAQAEHDPNARAIFVTNSNELAQEVIKEVKEILIDFAADSPAHVSWQDYGEVILTESVEESIEVCNVYASEHLHIHLKNADEYVEKLRNYGSLFIGEDSSVVFSDKVSGTNHTLPTMKAATYTGGLWVGSYVKVQTHQKITGIGVDFLAQHASQQSEIEGLEGHKLSATCRLASLNEVK
ncbi:histidinol dehydrogenase [Lysinibacillus endophyticus]|uniref:histidinol dehydrogenase n=1 Tax=Ureibacillus endophyticus TaxID=1978490 RepID=UPI00209DEB0E|nr:histidinol dehydrogenase [Lysinibacillus endophyticus]MCP1146772.1 histidinol dehydrogenase [Lysinibacillus endophyticus]